MYALLLSWSLAFLARLFNSARAPRGGGVRLNKFIDIRWRARLARCFTPDTAGAARYLAPLAKSGLPDFAK